MKEKALIEFCRANPYAMKLIFTLAEEHRPDKVTSVWSAVATLEANEISVNYSQMISLFRRLEDFECGTFFVGRKGKKSRFYWTIDIKIIAKALEDNSVDAALLPKVPAQPHGAPSTQSNTIVRHTFHLRQDFELVLSLPANLTEKDAQRISKFVESLPQ